jgi:two-component system, chemotaxis family, sensor kinase Cph1
MNTEQRRERADLSNFDLEPIHIPASIQPHGALMVLREPISRSTQVSENAVPEDAFAADQLPEITAESHPRCAECKFGALP